MKLLADFFPRIGTHVVGCPEPTMSQALLDSAIAFCEDSLVQREMLDSFSTEIGTASYEMDPPAQQKVARVLDVVVDGVKLKNIPQDVAVGIQKVSGQPTGYYTTRSGYTFEVVLYPVPDKVCTVSVLAALKPSRTATQLDDDLFERWVEPIVAGAIARITAIPNQPFSDMSKSQYAALTAAAMAKKARAEESFGRARGSMSIRLRPNTFA